MHTNYTGRQLKNTKQGLNTIERSALWGEENMRHRVARYSMILLAFAAVLLVPSGLRAQDEESKGIDSGNYHIDQTLEFGYRDSLISGNMNNYNTFVHLGDGVRLFDYTLDMRSLDHNGAFFDNLSFSNFGYGGDPNDMSRLRIEKNKWYDFRYMFRRDKNFWNYDLLTNPLNQAAATGLAKPQPIDNSPHALNLVRRMQDFDLTLLPESRVRFRLGYSRNVNEGPAFTTSETGVPMISQSTEETENAYRAGIDFRILPKTMISYDQSLIYYKEDNKGIDPVSVVGGTNYTYPYYQTPTNTSGVAGSTPTGTPVDLGLAWWTAPPAGISATPCAAPVTSATSTPLETASATCAGVLSYSFTGRPRNYMPTETLRIQSSYFKNLDISASAGYSTSDNSIPDYLQTMIGWVSRTSSRGSTTGGPATAKRVSVNANGNAVYRVTDKFRIMDTFRYDNWRIPGVWDTLETNLYPTLAPAGSGLAGIELPIGTFNSTNCPTAPYNQASCPQHSSSSAGDVVNEIAYRFLGQNLKTNTFELKYDFTPRVSAYIGYLYTNRTIADFNAVFDTGIYYFPGGTAGTAANYYLAARGDCAIVAPATTLPAGCTLLTSGPLAGAIVAGSPTSPIPEAGNDTARSILTIDEHSVLVGVNARPIDKLQIISDVGFEWYDKTFVRTDPRELQNYKVHAIYKPTPWATVDGSVEIRENRDNVATVYNLEHNRLYNFSTTLMPNPRLAVEFGYSFWDVYTQSLICFPYNAGTAAGGSLTGCPAAIIALPGAPTPETSTLYAYDSNTHYAFADLMWKPYKRVTATVGYSGNITRAPSAPYFAPLPSPSATATLLNPYQPTDMLDFNYIRPYASLAVNLYKGLTYKTQWNYYGYNEKGPPSPTGFPTVLAPLPLQDFNGNNITFVFRYAF